MSGAIEVENLRFTYPRASRPAVDGMSFHVGRGEVFGFLGPNGAGKTTTQRILVGLLSGWKGAVRLLGRERSTWGRELYDRIGVSFELPAGYGRLTARENLEHFANLHEAQSRDLEGLLEALGLGESSERLVSTFSKGMMKILTLPLYLPVMLWFASGWTRHTLDWIPSAWSVHAMWAGSFRSSLTYAAIGGAFCLGLTVALGRRFERRATEA